jgi:signal transduction histidine kinase
MPPPLPRVSALRSHGDEIAAGVFALLWLTGVVSGPVPTGHRDLAVFAVCGLLLTVPLAWRRRAPQLVVLVVYGAGLAQAFLRSADLPIGFIVTSLVAGYSLGAYARGRRAWVTFAVVVVVIAITNLPHNDSGVGGVILTPVLFLVVPWALGRVVTRLTAERGALHRLTLQLEREQEDVARASVLEERARIARELHDIVAHSISVMVVQAGAAEQFTDATSRAREPLKAIRLTGQQALVEMRHLLGILRTDNDARLTLAPQPGLDNIESLVDAARSSGLNVTVTTQGEPVPLPPGVDVAAYRLVQESFSNVRKHARAQSATVTLNYEPSCLTIEVGDDGVGAPDGAGADGHGLIGMRERVSLYGGRLECGPRTGGGWRVWAQLPITA